MKILFILLFTITSQILLAQTNYLVFDHITVEDRLSNNGVSAIYQDHKGLIWIGTFNGLNLYNAYEMKTYFNDSYDPHSISDSRITRIYEDKAKNLWIGTHNGGLNLYNRDKDNFIRFNAADKSNRKISSNTIECIFEDSRGNLWVGTDYGLNLINKERNSIKSFYNTPGKDHTINSNHIFSIVKRMEKFLFSLIKTN